MVSLKPAHVACYIPLRMADRRGPAAAAALLAAAGLRAPARACATLLSTTAFLPRAPGMRQNPGPRPLGKEQ